MPIDSCVSAHQDQTTSGWSESTAQAGTKKAVENPIRGESGQPVDFGQQLGDRDVRRRIEAGLIKAFAVVIAMVTGKTQSHWQKHDNLRLIR